MTSTFTQNSVVLAVLLAATLGGCGPPPFVESPADDIADPADDVAAARATLAELGAARFADGARPDLARIDRWLDAVDQSLSDGDRPEAQLALRTARAGLATIKSYYARREAETVLDEVRVDFVRGRGEIEELEQENLRLLESPEDLP